MRVIVAGAGPAGATAALALARSGARVWLVEKSAWPRDKTCGDAVSPLGVHLGTQLGLAIEGRVRLPRARISTPGGRSFTGGWPAATPWGTTIPRRTFDASLVDAALATGGVEFLARTQVRSLAAEGAGVRATLRADGADRTLDADAAIVADGANGPLSASLGAGPYRSQLVAVRGYADAPRALPSEYGLFYDRPLAPGYGWVFPIDGGRANAGILVDRRTLERRGGDARALLTRWLAQSRFARELLGDRPALEDVRGGLIPSGRGRRAAGPILFAGDAAGVADPFTAEGIYQAMDTGRAAARALATHGDPVAAGRAYERETGTFDRNERAARGVWRTFGATIEVCAWRAHRRPAFADGLNTAVFFPKSSFEGFVWSLLRAW
jgi:geranylgeranyl reductase family protein